jgi:hypothetical protein
MPRTSVENAPWPALPLESWRDTYATLHMWTQVVGKVSLALTPRTNHFWNIAFRVTARGLATPLMKAGDVALTMTFDFIGHQLLIECSDGRTERIALEPRTVADFYRLVMEALHRLGIAVRIWTMPVEVPSPVRFEEDTAHASYDAASAQTFWGVLVAIAPVFEQFRSEFLGKSSPFHFFWGSFDVALTRFSGRRAPERPGADPVTRESYSHEVISHGFWPGGTLFSGGFVGEPVFYAYAAPEPEGFKTASIRPDAASYSELGEFFLPYERVRTAASPAADLMTFLRSTYDAAATLAGWNRAELERQIERV